MTEKYVTTEKFDASVDAIKVTMDRIVQRLEDQGHVLTAIKKDLTAIKKDLTAIKKELAEHDARFDAIDAKLLEHDAKFIEHDARFDAIDAKLAEHDDELEKTKNHEQLIDDYARFIPNFATLIDNNRSHLTRLDAKIEKLEKTVYAKN